MRIRDVSENLVVSGHNNKIDITAPVSNSVVAGHNNKMACSSSNSAGGAILDNLAILGHNNRIENLTIK